jgi:hypothetical protein
MHSKNLFRLLIVSFLTACLWTWVAKDDQTKKPVQECVDNESGKDKDEKSLHADLPILETITRRLIHLWN